MLLVVLVVVSESHPREQRDRLRSAARQQARNGARAMLSRAYIGHVLAFAFAFAVMMAYISASPFLYQTMIGLTEVQYGLLFGLNALALMGTSLIAARLARRVPTRTLLGRGLCGAFAGSVAFLVIALTGVPAGWLVVGVVAATAPLGFVLGTGTALALGAVPRAAGSASAVLGATQFVLAAIVSPLVSIGGEETAIPCAIVMVAAALIALLSYRAAGRSPVRAD